VHEHERNSAADLLVMEFDAVVRRQMRHRNPRA
jgi:hypothetical protein